MNGCGERRHNQRKGETAFLRSLFLLRSVPFAHGVGERLQAVDQLGDVGFMVEIVLQLVLRQGSNQVRQAQVGVGAHDARGQIKPRPVRSGGLHI